MDASGWTDCIRLRLTRRRNPARVRGLAEDQILRIERHAEEGGYSGRLVPGALVYVPLTMPQLCRMKALLVSKLFVLLKFSVTVPPK